MLFPPGVAAIKFACPSRLSGEAKKAPPPPPPPSIGRRSHNSFFTPSLPPFERGEIQCRRAAGKKKKTEPKPLATVGLRRKDFCLLLLLFAKSLLGRRVPLNIVGFEMTG